MKKKTYITPLIEVIHVGLPSILAGTISESTPKIEDGGDAGYDEEGLSRRGGGFWDDDF